MCGIFGILYSDGESVPDEAKLRAAAQSVVHRGPDAQSTHSGPGIGLAHTRLSFLDIDARSNQPFWDRKGRYALVYNGEIYNFAALRDELEQSGIQFRTTSDTEVLLEALIHYSPESILPRLKGMFAFAFYDKETKSLLLARDRFGMKPLYYLRNSECFMFGSEIKALQPWTALSLDRFSIASYLLKFGGPTKGFTFYNGLHSLAPGDMIRVDRSGVVQQSTFYALQDFVDIEQVRALSKMSSTKVVDVMDELMTESVDLHMFADVPVGAFCSGGVDSSLLMAIAARTHNNLAIFHANVKGQWSEHDAAVALSEHLKLDLKTVEVEEQDFVDLLPKVMQHYEHPFTYHPNCAPLMMVAQLARDSGVKGLLSGEGSDECFLGYPWLGRKKIMDRYYSAGRKLRSLTHKVLGFGPLLWPDEGNNHHIVRAMLNRREIEDDEVRTARVMDSVTSEVPEETAWTLDYLHYHLRTLLHRNDTMGMAASIEARFPFLDHDVVAMAVNMPARHKLRFSARVLEKAHPFVRDKWIVRKVADRYIPKLLSERIKIGFWTTVFQRMQVSPRLFDGSFVQNLFELTSAQTEAICGTADQDLLMRLLHLDVWGEVCFESTSADAYVSRLRDHVTIRPE